VTFHTNATIYRSDLDSGQAVSLEETNGRRLFVYLTQGSLDMNDHILQEKDQARADIEVPLVIRARQRSEFILVNVPSCKGWGYDGTTLQGAKA
jgi:redox-sensitive bicupin YhaK (pirin superfamily)